MKSIMSKSEPTSFSFSRRFFNWKNKFVENDLENLTFSTSSHFNYDNEDSMINDYHDPEEFNSDVTRPPRKNLHFSAVSKLRSAFTVFSKGRGRYHSGLGTKLIGTLFGYRRGHVHFAFQEDAKLSPAFMIELAIPTSILVREMASGLVRIALECEKKIAIEKKKKKATATKGLLEEPLWRTYCNGKKCGYAMRRQCGPDEWKVLKALEPISMGAGVLPVEDESTGHELEGEVMYMRARFERVVGSKDSEAFYMVNPDRSRSPELSVFLLRV